MSKAHQAQLKRMQPEIQARLGSGESVGSVWKDLADRHGIVASRRTFYRFIRALEDAQATETTDETATRLDAIERRLDALEQERARVKKPATGQKHKSRPDPGPPENRNIPRYAQWRSSEGDEATRGTVNPLAMTDQEKDYAYIEITEGKEAADRWAAEQRGRREEINRRLEDE